MTASAGGMDCEAGAAQVSGAAAAHVLPKGAAAGTVKPGRHAVHVGAGPAVVARKLGRQKHAVEPAGAKELGGQGVQREATSAAE